MLLIRVPTTFTETVCNCFQTGTMAFEAFLNALLHFLIHLIVVHIVHLATPSLIEFSV